MAEQINIQMDKMAHGGKAMGFDKKKKRTIFVPYAIPGEWVDVAIHSSKSKYAQATLLSIKKHSLDRVKPQCPHFGMCSGCHFQHITYEQQLHYKFHVLKDQITRLARLDLPQITGIFPNPKPYQGSAEIVLSPRKEGGLGLWSAKQQRVIEIEQCHLIDPALNALRQMLDFELPTLRKVTLRMGMDEQMLVALETEGAEAPPINVDFPVSVVLVHPDRTTETLIGDPDVKVQAKGRVFLISAGTLFYPSLSLIEPITDRVLRWADLKPEDTLLELYPGAGIITAFLSERCHEVVVVESNRSAVMDMAVNLEHTENVSVYGDWAEEVLPALPDLMPDVVTIYGDTPLSTEAIQMIGQKHPRHIVYLSQDLSAFTEHAKDLDVAGYELKKVHPFDMAPQTFHLMTVSLWQPKRNQS